MAIDGISSRELAGPGGEARHDPRLGLGDLGAELAELREIDRYGPGEDAVARTQVGARALIVELDGLLLRRQLQRQGAAVARLREPRARGAIGAQRERGRGAAGELQRGVEDARRGRGLRRDGVDEERARGRLEGGEPRRRERDERILVLLEGRLGPTAHGRNDQGGAREQRGAEGWQSHWRTSFGEEERQRATEILAPPRSGAGVHPGLDAV
jgi:hypothetical protein